MTADQHPAAQNLAKMGFRQIVQFIESQLTAPTIEATDTADIFRRFPELANVGIRDVTIDGTHGDIPGRIYTSTDVATTGFVWVHGGAFIGGGLEMPEAHWASLRRVAGVLGFVARLSQGAPRGALPSPVRRRS